MTIKTNSPSGLNKKLKKAYNKNVYGSLDEIELTLGYKSFTDVGTYKCPKNILDLATIISALINEGKHPSINPIIDNLYDLFAEGDTTVILLQKYIEKNSDFKTVPVDNTKSFIEILTKIKILWVNIEPFLNAKNVLITKAEIQTPLFKQEINE